MTNIPLPAILGGPPVNPAGPPDWPVADDDVLLALQAAYRDGSWGKYHGNYVARFEEVLARYHRVGFATACASGTVAVEFALRALKIDPGDEVILAAYDYGGNFLGVHAVGAQPVLVDIAPHNWNLLPANVADAIGPKTRAVIASHLHGGTVPMRELMDVAAARGVAVIEDAAQAPGASVQGKKAGTWGDFGVLSFGGSKLLTAGRGGALLTDKAELHQRLRLVVHRGNHVCPLSELQAAVLLPQLEKLDARNVQRAANVRLLTELLGDVPGLRPFANAAPADRPGYYKLGFQYDAAAFGLSRQQFLAAVRAEGVAIDEGFTALHQGRSPRRLRSHGRLTEADRAHEGTVVLHHPVLLGGVAGVEKVAGAVRKVHAHVDGVKAQC
jgi:dTDP-4-amino-4,6-dideoxygalactose transaminase